MRMITVAMCVVLAGCAPQRWNKPGGTDQEFQRDMASCRMQVAMVPQRQAPYGSGAGAGMVSAGVSLENAAIQMQFMDDCLTSRGWYRASQ